LKVYLSKDVVENLWRIIRQKYKKPYGALSLEVEQAIVNWIKLHDTQIHTKPTNPLIPKAHQYASDIIQYLKRQGFVNQVSLRELRKAIIALRGSDYRTIRKWIRFLVENGFIKQLNYYLYEIL